MEEQSHTPLAAAQLLDGCMRPWWVAGGWAIDLWLGSQTRPHDDLDLAILRADQAVFWDRLAGWDLELAVAPGVLRPLETGEEVVSPFHAVWCRPGRDAAWAFEMLLNDSDGLDWLFRRDHRVRLRLSHLGGRSHDGIPYLQPEVVLLFKAKSVRDYDSEDFERVRPTLSDSQAQWLADALLQVHPGHLWLDAL